MLKKLATLCTTLALTVGIISACGTSDDSQNGEGGSEAYIPETLTVQFVPSQNAETLEAKAKPLEGLLSDELGIPVEVSVSTNYNTIIEAMASKKVDVGFLPPTAYVLAKEKGAAEVILQAQRYGVDDETGQPTDELVDGYKSEIIVKADSGIDSLEDLKGKKIAFQDVTSSAGYVWPAAALMDVDIDPLQDVESVTVKGHDQGVLAVLNGDVDAAGVFQDARNIVSGDYPDVFKDTKVIHFTEFIPNDTVSVRSDMDKEWVDKITEAFINIGESEEGHKIIKEIYTHEGYVESDDSKFDIVRDYAERVKTE
ncbi:phosphate/phosphite/phosphonate ABC transporter substrate-binding protein [Radiobacillus kanasensis]|uniref:phosphate/phosphite/phosphonate ABC transporter substrate-binding protein n=1 Tax=Radiobacillus kanasensis TaxID=2844358 RepID=UPI001E4459AF|nr:phosphate/phosphite/phosphonate ABC transporter substrate-binding protein [Radiobacillus kanasensis]UFT99076.1 phosphate/phosphite/phosphonate ABC transporter substrate-binding protein [Radiobacillus kanasensis]